jgi:HSF-type DNA-binding
MAGEQSSDRFRGRVDQINISSDSTPPNSKDEQRTYLDEYSGSPLETSIEVGQRPTKKFPAQIFEMLDHAEKDGLSHIISWQPHGRCFVMHMPSEIDDVLKRYLPGITKKRSFQRQASEAKNVHCH